LRIKSYFDSSIPTAMRQARHEFGDDVMLVTSRIASPEFRYLGDFEIVFAVDENETGPKATPPQSEPPPTAPAEMFRLASAVPPAEDARDAAIVRIHALLSDMGLEPAIAEAVIGLIRSCPLCSAAPLTLTIAAHDPIPSAADIWPPPGTFGAQRQSGVALPVNTALTRQTDDVLRKVLAVSASMESAGGQARKT
jgi:hypothetical protein